MRLDRGAQVIQFKFDAGVIDAFDGARRMQCEEHEEFHKRENSHGDEIHRFDSHAVVHDQIGMDGDGGTGVAGDRDRSLTALANEIKRCDAVGRIAALRDNDREGVDGKDMLAGDIGLGGHNDHLHAEHILHEITHAQRGMT